MHTFSPAKMWIAGLDALRKPLLHLHTQANVALPWADIDMDFMNLNQAAHGDREFGYIQTRLGVARKTVAGHVSDPRVARPDRGLGAGRDRLRGDAARCGWPASATTCATSPSPRATRSRPSCGSASRSTPTASTTWSTPSDAVLGRRRRRAGQGVRRHLPGAPRAAGRRRAARLAALRGAHRAGPAHFLDGGGFRAFTTNFEDLGGLRQLPGLAVQRLMADGYGFGGEGDWKTSVLVRTLEGDGGRPAGRHVVHGGLHLST